MALSIPLIAASDDKLQVDIAKELENGGQGIIVSLGSPYLMCKSGASDYSDRESGTTSTFTEHNGQ